MGVICKYKFDSSIYADFIPGFNSGYSDYTITDEVDSENSNHIIRTILGNSLPTKIQFGTDSTTEPITNFTKAVIDVMYLNVSNITSMKSMFRNCHSLKNINCSDWDTSNVTNLHSTFAGCVNLTSLDLSNWDTSNVTTMNWMFMDSNNLSTIGDISNWDTGNVTNMACMFYNCDKLTSLDLSNFNTSKVTDMSNMFRTCSKLTSLDVSNWDTSNVTDMSYMFHHCKNLASLDVSNFDTSKVNNMTNMFNSCFNLTSLDVSNFDTSKTTHMEGMFNGCTNLTSLDVSDFDTTNVTRMNYMFANCLSLTSLDVSNFNTTEVTMMNYMFQGCSNLTNLDLSNFDTSNVTNTTNMFTNTNSLEVITMFNNDINTINVVGNLTSATIYVGESLDQTQYTGTAPLKIYKEDKVEIKLNSPLLEGDTIEVVDGKLCHVHRCDKVVLNGSEDGGWYKDNTYPIFKYNFDKIINGVYLLAFCDNFPYIASAIGTLDFNCFKSQAGYLQFRHISCDTLDTFKKWLQANPTTVVYQLATPYYEDITPLQSSIILKTFLESSMTIDTNLPIETKLSYRTNVPSISALSTRATELAESDNVIHNLMNIIDDEVDE